MQNLKIDFEEIYTYALRAKAAYGTASDIQQQFSDTVRVATLPKHNVQYFLEVSDRAKLQTVSVRGTSNLLNWETDADYVEGKDGELGIYVHRGFEASTTELYQDLMPHLRRDYALRATGHSLGAAIATLLTLFCQLDGYAIKKCINFGQPKITNKKGVEKYHALPLLRLVDENDVVPLVPPRTLLDSVHGAYEHFGPEIILLTGQYYVYLDEAQSEQKSIDSFWKDVFAESIKEHFMDKYLLNIKSKLDAATAVDYNQRERYV